MPWQSDLSYVAGLSQVSRPFFHRPSMERIGFDRVCVLDYNFIISRYVHFCVCVFLNKAYCVTIKVKRKVQSEMCCLSGKMRMLNDVICSRT